MDIHLRLEVNSDEFPLIIQLLQRNGVSFEVENEYSALPHILIPVAAEVSVATEIIEEIQSVARPTRPGPLFASPVG